MDNIKKIQLSQTIFTHIIHISDTHIRPTERHNEFQQVFETFYKKLDEIKNNKIKAIVIITGDIFDNKNRYNPAQYDLCSRFFDEIVTRFPLIVITGNHDIRDYNYIDSITPSAYKRKNFYYLRDTGIYTIGNVDFVVSSLYDPENKFIVRKNFNSDNMCIALYHGTLSGSVNDDNFVFTNKNNSSRFRSKLEFKGYDAVLLGDIHKMQSLEKTMWYSGSMIQQNHGESLDGHGFLLWDISKKKPKISFHELFNSYGMVTLKVNSGKITEKNIRFPKQSNIRFITTNTTVEQIEKCMKMIEKKENINIVDYSVVNNDTIIFNNNDKNDVDDNGEYDQILCELKKMQIKDKDDQLLEQVIELHKSYAQKLNITQDDSVGYLWYPKTLTFQNLFGYNSDKEYMINLRNGVTSITAPNASGKTSIINIIIFMIFNKLLYKGTQNIDILNNKENKGHAQISICHGTTIYTIVKELVRQTKSKTNPVVIKTTIQYSQNGQQVILHDSVAYQKMKQLFGTIEDFHKCNILNTRDQSSDFFGLSNIDKIKYLKDVFRLNYFDELVEINKQKLQEVENEMSKNKIKLDVVIKDFEYFEKGDTCVGNIKKNGKVLHEKIEELQIEYDNMTEECDKLKYKICEAKNKITDVDDTEKNLLYTINEIKKKFKYDNEELKYNCNIEKLKIKLAVLRNNFDDLLYTEDIDDLIDKLNELKKNNAELDEDYDFDKISIKLGKNKNKVKDITQKLNEIKKEMKSIPNDVLDINIDDNESEDDIENKIFNAKKNIVDVENINVIQLKKQLNKTKETLNNSELESKQKDELNEMKLINCQNLEYLEKKIKKYVPYKGNKNIKKYDIDVVNKQLKELGTMKEVDKNEYYDKKKELENYKENKNSTIDIDIINYVQLIDTYIEKQKLLRKDFDKMKTELLEPVKNIMINIESVANTHSIISKKKLLQEEIDKMESQIQNNKEIEKFQSIAHNLEYLQILGEKKKLIQKQSEINKYLDILEKQHLIQSIKYNKALKKEIIDLNKVKKKLRYNQLNSDYESLYTGEQMTRQTKLNEIQKIYDVLIIKNNIDDIQNKIHKFKENNELYDKIQNVQNKLNREEGKNMINDCVDQLEKIKKNKEMETLVQKLETQINNILYKVKKVQQKIHTLTVEMNQNILLTEKYERNKDDINKMKMKIDKLNSELQKVKYYAKLISPRVLQVIIVRNKLIRLEDTMNNILSKYTKYKIKIDYDNGNNIKIHLSDDNKYIRTNLLSAYENIVLLTAFKHSVAKQNVKNRGRIYIMDESLENMDENNFNKTLPELIKIIQNEYSHILMVSQRDLKHVTNNEIRIKKVNGIQKLIET